ncbi:MAG: hypothetical protein H8D45_31030 [Bacteroidetes bacterium]|nr:hypothetical protein [Bacteroidota bacterium]
MANSDIKSFTLVITVICLLLSVGFNAGNVVAKALVNLKIEQMEKEIDSIRLQNIVLEENQDQIINNLPEIQANLKRICEKLDIPYTVINTIKKNE